MFSFLADQQALDLVAENFLQNSNEMPMNDFGAALTKIFLTLIALLLLLGGSVWVLRKLIQQKLQRGSGSQIIHLLEKKMISPKTMLYVIEIENKKIILAESQLEIRKIDAVSSFNLEETNK